MTALLVFLGAAIGAPLRYLTDRTMRARFGGSFPWGTFIVNIAGGLVLGVITGAAPSANAQALLGTGFCGALTTYSTFGYDTVSLVERGRYRQATGNVAGSVSAGIAGAAIGYALGTLLR